MATAGLLALGVWSSAAVAQTPPGDGTVETTAQPEQTAAPETTAASEPTTTRRQREEDIPGTDETVPPDTAPPVTETTPAPPVVEAIPPAAPTPPAANPATRTPVAAPAPVAAAPAPDSAHLPVTGSGGVAILAGLSLALAATGLLLRRARRRTDEILISRPL
jgi:cytoskeletal protein RodZ